MDQKTMFDRKGAYSTGVMEKKERHLDLLQELNDYDNDAAWQHDLLSQNLSGPESEISRLNKSRSVSSMREQAIIPKHLIEGEADSEKTK